ncbi:CCA-adding enzyme [Oxobacter pfennigii]|uniref:CCA-adding enzyme n=1 Tax=Oxobacter pfennigii TaxID=36849 RepID=A0A0P8W5C8_9CLOT|nr:CCA tRNA nucleotidyltransferase [Oxobacter pfennigii]KPU43833.1 CCA-adding enzyme [Oxobacter pfennigii]
MKLKLPAEVNFIIKKLNDQSFEAYIVGGCVRDILLLKEPKDWDICTNALPQMVTDIFKSFCKVIPTGAKHGTVTLLLNKKHFEVTTYRIDGAYSDFRRPDSISFTSSIEEDLSRRDFTINAMAYNPSKGLIDPHGGQRDLSKKVINCVGDPEHRLFEDYLRALRAVRFSCQLEFEISPATSASIKRHNDLIIHISKERIREEFIKILLSTVPEKGVKIFIEYGLLFYIIPELIYVAESPLFLKSLKALGYSPADLITRLAIILYPVRHANKKPANALKYLRFDNDTAVSVSNILDCAMALPSLSMKAVKKFMTKAGIQNLDMLFDLLTANAKAADDNSEELLYIENLKDKCSGIIKEKEPLTLKDLDIDGNDIKALGVVEGKKIGKLLNTLLDIVLDEPKLNDKEILKNILKDKFI